MRYKVLSLVLSLFVLPLTMAGGTAAAAGRPDAQGFRILFSDGRILAGAMSFTLDIDTQYGRTTVLSTNFLWARFNSTSGWATICTNGTQLRLQYKPSSSDLEATTDMGQLNVDLTKVVSIETLGAEVPNAAPPVAVTPYGQGTPPVVPSYIYAGTPTTGPQTIPYASGASPYANPGYVAPQTYASSYGNPPPTPQSLSSNSTTAHQRPTARPQRSATAARTGGKNRPRRIPRRRS